MRKRNMHWALLVACLSAVAFLIITIVGVIVGRQDRTGDKADESAQDHSFVFEQHIWQKRYQQCQHDHSLWHAPLWEHGLSYSYFCFKCGLTWVYLDEPGIVYSPPLVGGHE